MTEQDTVKHGTAEGFFAGCKCVDCLRAEPDAEAQAAFAQGATARQAAKVDGGDN